MKTIINLFLLLTLFSCSSQQVGEMANILMSTAAGSKPSEAEAASGLKDTLRVGFVNAISGVSKKDGFYKNPALKIPLPNELQAVTKTLNKLGLSSLTGEVDKLFNRAAEKASGEAKEVFVSAISQMTIQDAFSILMGNGTEATEFLKRTTTNKLMARFSPVVQNSLNKVGALDAYNKVVSKYNAIPLIDDVNVDVTKFVANKAISGLFSEVAKEEMAIRKDPAKRTTALIKRVFGYVDSQK